jgi:C1A family cysteine protease
MKRFRFIQLAAASLIVLVALRSTEAQNPKPLATKSRVDLRSDFEKRKLEVRHQGKRGACQVFAFVSVLEFQLSKPGRPVDLSEQFLMWAANDAKDMTRTDGFNGDWLVAGIKKNGICLEGDMPYVPRNEPIDKPSDKALQDALRRIDCELTTVKHWSSDVGFTEEHFKQITAHLQKKQPVTATFCWPFGLYDEQTVDARYFLIDRSVDGTNKSGHGVVLVGYVLDKKVDGGGYFIARNSWGQKFADKGYVGITFDYAKKYGVDAYFVTVRQSAKASKKKADEPPLK